MISVDAILFDLDGTLIDSRLDLAGSVRHLQKRYHVRPSTVQEVATFIGDGVGSLVRRALPDVHGEALKRAVHSLQEHYRDHCLDRTRAYPGVKKTLDHFRHKPMAVVTNKPFRVSARILGGLGMSHYFSVLIGGDSLPEKKPHPEPILNALRTLGLKPSKRIVMVGDGPNDVLSGRAARVRTCAVRSNISDYQKVLRNKPDMALDKIAELILKIN